MKRKKVFLVILIFSIFLTLLGFIVDSDEYVPDIVQNTLDFLLMTALFFGFFSLCYLFGSILIKSFSKE